MYVRAKTFLALNPLSKNFLALFARGLLYTIQSPTKMTSFSHRIPTSPSDFPSVGTPWPYKRWPVKTLTMLTKYEMFKIIKDINEPMEQRYSKKRATAWSFTFLPKSFNWCLISQKKKLRFQKFPICLLQRQKISDSLTYLRSNSSGRIFRC